MRTTMRAALATLIVAGLACGDSGGSGPSGLKPSTDYRGIITASDGTTAGLVLTFSSAVAIRALASPAADVVAFAVIPATGVAILPGGGTVNLTGTLDDNALSMTGGGYTLTGTLKNGSFTGTFTGPGGASGTFAALSSTDVTPAYPYCGTYAGVITPGDVEEDGSFNLVVAGTILSGSSNSSEGDIVGFTGRAAAGPNGTTTVTVNQTSAQGTIKANGSITADYSTVSGTFQASVAGEGGVNNGTFEGILCTGAIPSLH